MMNQREINKNKPYYGTSIQEESMSAEADLQKSRNEKYLKALQTLAEKDPEGFSALAPELIKRSVWNLRGPDPYFSEKLSNWFEVAYKWEDFKEILPNDAHLTKRTNVELQEKKIFPNSILNSFQNSNSGFLEITNAGMRQHGINSSFLACLPWKGKTVLSKASSHTFLGNGLDGIGGLPSSNAIRAAKIALSRQAKPLNLFSPSKETVMHAFTPLPMKTSQIL